MPLSASQISLAVLLLAPIARADSNIYYNQFIPDMPLYSKGSGCDAYENLGYNWGNESPCTEGSWINYGQTCTPRCDGDLAPSYAGTLVENPYY